MTLCQDCPLLSPPELEKELPDGPPKRLKTEPLVAPREKGREEYGRLHV